MRAFIVLLLVLAVQQPPRDAAPAPAATGTGVIRGRVLTDHGAPIRRALVTIGAERAGSRQIYTDAQGRYEARNLPPGAYRVWVRPNVNQAQFLQPRAPASPVAPVPLAAGQTIEWYDLTLPRAGAIVGRVVDRFGDPVSGVQVTAERVGSPTSTWAAQSSDELGRFRVFRLEPGEYEVLAKPSGATDRVPGDNTGFVHTYYPGTLSRQETVRVTVRSGQDTTLGDLELVSGRLLRLSGIAVSSAGRAGPATSISLSRDGSGTGRSLDASGQFQFDGLMPGTYRLTARTLSDSREALLEYAAATVTLSDTDVGDLVVTMKPTVTLSGRVVFEGAAMPPKLTNFTVRAEPPQRQGVDVSIRPANVGEDLTFTLHHLATELLLRPGGGASGMWSLKSVLLGNEDITDVPREFRAEDSGRIQVVLTDRWAELTGSVTGDKGERITGRTVLLFSDDKSTWFAESSRMRAAAAPNGAFAMRGLRAGRYLLAVLPRDMRWDFQRIDKTVLERLAGEAIPVVLGESDRRDVDLKVSSSGG